MKSKLATLIVIAAAVGWLTAGTSHADDPNRLNLHEETEICVDGVPTYSLGWSATGAGRVADLNGLGLVQQFTGETGGTLLIPIDGNNGVTITLRFGELRASEVLSGTIECDTPVTTEPPATTTPPATTEPPIDEPVTTEPPATDHPATIPSATTEPPVTTIDEPATTPTTAPRVNVCYLDDGTILQPGGYELRIVAESEGSTEIGAMPCGPIPFTEDCLHDVAGRLSPGEYVYVDVPAGEFSDGSGEVSFSPCEPITFADDTPTDDTPTVDTPPIVNTPPSANPVDSAPVELPSTGRNLNMAIYGLLFVAVGSPLVYFTRRREDGMAS